MAIRFAKLGCRVVLWDVNQTGNEETVSLCKEYGGTVKAYTINLCDREDVYHVANKVNRKLYLDLFFYSCKSKFEVVAQNKKSKRCKHLTIHCHGKLMLKSVPYSVVPLCTAL